MKKHWPLLVGVTVLTGAIGSAFFKKQKKKKPLEDGIHHLYNLYLGKWEFIDKQNELMHTLTIDNHLTILIDEKEFTYTLIELTPKRFVAQDEYGYHIIIQCSNQKPTTLYDEADDITYVLHTIL